jgi:hypothetical protein
MDYENTDISKTLKKHMGSNSRQGKICLVFLSTFLGTSPPFSGIHLIIFISHLLWDIRVLGTAQIQHQEY